MSSSETKPAGVVSYRDALETELPPGTAPSKNAEIRAVPNEPITPQTSSKKEEQPIWKKAVIGGAIALLVVAAGLRLRKAADEGELDEAEEKIRKAGKDAGKKGKTVKGEAKKAARKVESGAKESASWVGDKTRDVLDVTGVSDAAEATSDALTEAKDAAKDKVQEAKENLQHAQNEADSKARKVDADQEARRMADKDLTEDDGFLGWKKWFSKDK